MKCREVTDTAGREFELTESEEKFVRALERLEKMDQGRIHLFANGRINLRINGWEYENDFGVVSVSCDGGDGGD